MPRARYICEFTGCTTQISSRSWYCKVHERRCVLVTCTEPAVDGSPYCFGDIETLIECPAYSVELATELAAKEDAVDLKAASRWRREAYENALLAATPAAEARSSNASLEEQCTANLPVTGDLTADVSDLRLRIEALEESR